jgi:hypothetical protein
MMVIMLAAAVSSALIMLFWPSFEAPKNQMIVRHYVGHSHTTPETEPASRQLHIPIPRCFLMALAQLRRVGAYLGLAS